MDMLTLFRINSYYPERTAIVDIKNTNTNTYSAALFKYENRVIGDIIYSLPRFDYKTGEEAIDVLIAVVDKMRESILTMSN